jgi:DNA-binding PadR family transcriptional regulator
MVNITTPSAYHEGARMTPEAAPADARDHLPLKPDLFHILLALEEGDRHGYGIIKEVERSTAGEIRLEPSPLYRRLKRLLEAGIVEESEKRPAPELDDERRRYYRLTEHGRRIVAAEARRVVALARNERVRTLAAHATINEA